ncbi:MAG: hypothetical protein FWG20_02390 [Candidatus Cloacimonetes bacterium]|nr:hypothetical protein [Candidatus Cloacimonadota bacterium]
MTLDEIRETRKRMGEETKGMTSSQLAEYFDKAAEPMRVLLLQQKQDREAKNKK